MTIAILGRTIALSISKVGNLTVLADSTKQRRFSVVARKYGIFGEKVRPQWGTIPKSAKFPFWVYLLMLAGVWAILFIVAWVMGGDEIQKLVPIFTGYAIGAVTVYIAAHAIQR